MHCGDTEMAVQDGLERRPDIEILDPVLAVQEVQGGALAKSNSEQTVSVETPGIWMSAKERFQISECNVGKSPEIRLSDCLH
jgi:hypothetical protein